MHLNPLASIAQKVKNVFKPLRTKVQPNTFENISSSRYYTEQLNRDILTLMKRYGLDPASFEKIESDKPLTDEQKRWEELVARQRLNVSPRDEYSEKMRKSLAEGTEYKVDYESLYVPQQSTFAKMVSSSGRKVTLKAVDKLAVYVSIPSTTSEFQNIFQTHNVRQRKRTVDLYNTLKAESNQLIKFPSSASGVLKGVLEFKTRFPIVIIGHNEDGNILFPDGSAASFQELDSLAREAGRIIVYLSCNANEYTTSSPATSHFLTYEESIELANKLNTIKLLDSPSQKEIKLRLNNVLNMYAGKRDRRIVVTVVGITAGTVGVGYGLYIINEK
jgi:prepilin-type processing-associated H-X9-DG protein